MDILTIETKIWGYANTGSKLHAFQGDHAICNKNTLTRTYIRQGQGMDYCQAKTFGGALCKNCDKKFNEVIEASMESSTEAKEPDMTDSNYSPATPSTKRALVKPEISNEVIEALAWLRNGWDGDNSEKAIDALNVLDNAGVFKAIDEATGYDVDPAPERLLKGGSSRRAAERVSKCTCPPSYAANDHHSAGCPVVRVSKCTCKPGRMTKYKTHAFGCTGDPAEWVSRCTCKELDDRDGSHHAGCPGDPAEWGDLAWN